MFAGRWSEGLALPPGQVRAGDGQFDALLGVELTERHGGRVAPPSSASRSRSSDESFHQAGGRHRADQPGPIAVASDDGDQRGVRAA